MNDSIQRYTFDDEATLWAQPVNRERLSRWLDERFPHPPGLRCAACGKDEWRIGAPVRVDRTEGPPTEELLFRCRHCTCSLRFALDHLDLER